ncbi:MAG: hypothetical protein KDA72_20375, partial [Planctomycetales bacterium]|nr:hypothetical protein [Planctomycetales bacterium]
MIQGYNSSINDLNGGSGMPQSYANCSSGSYDTSQPLIEGTSRNSGVGIEWGEYLSYASATSDWVRWVDIRNFNITNCEWGVRVFGQNNTFTNIYIYEVSSIDTMAKQYVGCGIRFWGRSATFRDVAGDKWKAEKASFQNVASNCVVYNSAYMAFGVVNGHSNEFSNCMAFADDNSSGQLSSTDYYFDVTNSDDNDIIDCEVERHRDGTTALAHVGHGYVLSGYEDDGYEAV